LGNDRFQQQIAAMVGRRTWPGKSGDREKEPPEANQIELPISSRNRGLFPVSMSDRLLGSAARTSGLAVGEMAGIMINA